MAIAEGALGRDSIQRQQVAYCVKATGAADLDHNFGDLLRSALFGKTNPQSTLP
jgi:hypothetical protein